MFISLDKLCLFDNRGTVLGEIAHLDAVKFWLKTNILSQNKKVFYPDLADVDRSERDPSNAMNESSLHLISFLIHVCVSVLTHMPKDPPELQSPMVVSHLAGAGNQTQTLCSSNKSFLTTEPPL